MNFISNFFKTIHKGNLFSNEDSSLKTEVGDNTFSEARAKLVEISNAFVLEPPSDKGYSREGHNDPFGLYSRSENSTFEDDLEKLNKAFASLLPYFYSLDFDVPHYRELLDLMLKHSNFCRSSFLPEGFHLIRILAQGITLNEYPAYSLEYNEAENVTLSWDYFTNKEGIGIYTSLNTLFYDAVHFLPTAYDLPKTKVDKRSVLLYHKRRCSILRTQASVFKDRYKQIKLNEKKMAK